MGKRRTRRSREVEEPVSFWQTGLFKFITRLMLAGLVILVFLTLVQCTVKKPEAPEWNTTFVVPVVNRTYTMQELVDKIDQDEIIIDTSGDVAFSVSEDLDTVSVSDDDFSTPDLSYILNETLAPVKIEQPAPVNAVVSLDDLAAGYPTVPGFDTLIIPANTQLEATYDHAMETFNWVEVGDGSLKMVVSNDLGFTLYYVVVRVLDNFDGHTIEYDSLEVPLAHGETDSAVLILDGETFTNDLQLSVVGRTDPSNPVRVDPNGKQIAIDGSFSDPTEIVSAEAQIPALDDISFSQKIGLELDPSETLDSAHLETGSLSLVVVNNTPLAAVLDISTPNICSGGSCYTATQPVAAGATVMVNADLAGYTLVPDDDSVVIDVVAQVPGSGGSFVVINATDDIDVDAQITGLTFDRVTGVMANSSVDFDGIHEEFDVPEGFDNISLLTAILTIDVHNGIDFPGTVDITITGDNGKVINISGDIDPCGAQQSLVSTISNDDVADFLTPLPEAFDVSGTVTFGDDLYHGTLEKDDFVFARVHLYAPLEVKVVNAEITDLDIESEEIEQEDIDMITDHVVDARFVYSVTNHLPLGLTAVVAISNDTVSLFTSPLLELDTLEADPAPVSLATGIATSAAVSEGEIHLDNEDIQILKNDTLFIRPQIFLNASDTSGVKITENDYITISGRIEVVYRFDGEF
jgi:hypothetical protein